MGNKHFPVHRPHIKEAAYLCDREYTLDFRNDGQ